MFHHSIYPFFFKTDGSSILKNGWGSQMPTSNRNGEVLGILRPRVDEQFVFLVVGRVDADGEDGRRVS